MKQTTYQKSIAWFKLAEFVERGERERALGIYKLLALSINNKAFSYQLEGDILLAFEDSLAKEKYELAAKLYLEQENFTEAAGVLNHLVLLDPTILRWWQLLTDIYIKNYSEKIDRHLKNLVQYNQIEHAKNCIKEIVTKHKTDNRTNELNKLINNLELLDSDLHQFALQIKND